MRESNDLLWVFAVPATVFVYVWKLEELNHDILLPQSTLYMHQKGKPFELEDRKMNAFLGMNITMSYHVLNEADLRVQPIAETMPRDRFYSIRRDFSHSSRKAWRTINKLTGRPGRSSRLCPVSANSIASQLVKNGAHTRPAAASPPGSSTSSCPTSGRFQHLRVTVSPNPLSRIRLLLPSVAWSQESLRDWVPSSRSLYSMPGRLSNLDFASSSLPACANSKFQRSGEEH